jgi:hypothetical protein
VTGAALRGCVHEHSGTATSALASITPPSFTPPVSAVRTPPFDYALFMQADDSIQYQTLVDCLARRLVSRSTDQDTVEDLAEFASYLASELWPSLPPSLQTATYETRIDAPSADEVSLEALSPSFIESLLTYSLIPVADADADSAEVFARKVLEDYIPDVTAPPPIWKSTKTAECEMCDREVPLTYHHLIPRSTHAKVLKKGWHHESMLNSVAWLCRYVVC